MIKLTDATLLAFTKLRTRKVRTIVTIFMASILFGVLVAASLISTGFFKSVEKYNQDSLSSRYIVAVHEPADPGALRRLNRDPELIAKAKKMYEEMVAKKTVEAERLGIPYNQASDPLPYTIRNDGKETEVLNVARPDKIVQQILDEKFSKEPGFDENKLTSVAAQYTATDFFSEETLFIESGSSLEVLNDDTEVFIDTSIPKPTKEYVQPVLTRAFSIIPNQIAEPFLLPNNAGWEPSSGTLPIILQQNSIETLLDLPSLPSNATTKQKLDRLKKVHKEAKNLTFKACYRNNDSLALIQKTIAAKKDMTAHADDETYQNPSLVYKLPDPTTCENSTVVSDTRTEEQKLQAEKQELFNSKFGDSVDPTSYFVTFKVVGISPPNQGGKRPNQSRNLTDIISSLLSAQGVNQAIPKSLYDQIQDKQKFADILGQGPLSYIFGNSDNKNRFVEFASAKDAKDFIDEQSCQTQSDGKCHPLGRDYQARLAFSNSVALDDIKQKADRLFVYAMLGVVAIAVLIMWITISRTIADGRRETAVFRAIGFKRIDISLVYITYTIMLSLLVAAFAAGIGYALAAYVDYAYSASLTAQAQFSYGTIDATKQFSLIGFNKQQLAIILAACLGTGLVSILLPLMRNVRRNPIKDMRDE